MKVEKVDYPVFGPQHGLMAGKKSWTPDCAVQGCTEKAPEPGYSIIGLRVPGPGGGGDQIILCDQHRRELGIALLEAK